MQDCARDTPLAARYRAAFVAIACLGLGLEKQKRA
jgi:hypothetical protein